MSPSWIDRLLAPAQGSPSVGLHIGRWGVWVVKNTNGIRPAESRFHPMPVEAFRGELKSYAKAFTSMLAKSGLGAGADVLQVSLPDPAVRLEVFSVERIPGKGTELDEFLDWRFHEGKAAPGSGTLFTHQALGMSGNKKLLLAEAMERDWNRALSGVFQEAGIFPLWMDSGASFRFDLFHDRFVKTGKAGAFLTLEPDFWSLVLFDEKARIRFLRSKWWPSKLLSPARVPLRTTALEVDRTVRSFLFSGSREGNKFPSLETFFLCLPGAWKKPLGKGLSAHFKGWQLLPIGPDASSRTSKTAESPSAWAAAVPR